MENGKSGGWRSVWSESLYRRDTLIILVFSAIVWSIAVWVEAFESIVEFTEQHEDWELDEYITAMMVLPIALLVYSYRRLVESRAALAHRIEAEERASEMALHDPLTGLANRRKAEAVLTEAIKNAPTTTVAVLAIDLNRFKPINDLNGHAMGDQLLIAVGDRLKSAFECCGSACRMGGDEFLVIATIEDNEDLIRLTKTASSLFDTPFVLKSTSYTIGASIGAVSTTSAETLPSDMLAMADAAMYRCKVAGRNGYAFFEDGMELAARDRAQIESELRDAISSGSIEPHFQPLVELGSSGVIGFEALARWRLADGSYRIPDQFIHVAEETGLISELFFTILRQACLQVRTWPDHMRVAVNLSPVQFADEWLVSRILGVLTETGVPPGRLEIEITENALVANFDEARRVVQNLRDQGIHIALDDFGTGYSSLRHLSELPFDKIKIDRGFIHDLSENKTSEAIVRAVTSLAHELGLCVTAEGIDSGNANDVTTLGCDIGQGYHFGRPARSDCIEMNAANHLESRRSNSRKGAA